MHIASIIVLIMVTCLPGIYAGGEACELWFSELLPEPGDVAVDGQWIACLHDLALVGSDQLVRKLLVASPVISVLKRLIESRDGRTALEKARVRNRTEVVQMLCNPTAVVRGEFSVPFGMLDRSHVERLHDAASQGNVQEVQELISWNTSTKYPSHLEQFVASLDCRTALVKAAGRGHAQVVGVLLQAGADINACNGDALKKAACNGHAEVVKLLAQGSEFYVRGQTLLLATQKGRVHVVKGLCAEGMDTFSKNWALEKAVQKGDVEMVLALCDGGADPSMRSTCGKPLLSLAVERGFIEVIQVLCNAGARLDGRDLATTSTVIEEAKQEGNDQMVDILFWAKHILLGPTFK